MDPDVDQLIEAAYAKVKAEGRNGSAETAASPEAEGEEIPEDEWTDPVPLPHRVVSVLDGSCIPGALGKMAAAVSRATETPIELAALLGLAVVAASIAKKVVVQPEPGYIEPTNLYIAVGMESGNRKTAVQAHMTRPLVNWEHAETKRLKPEIQRLNRERKTIEARIEHLRKQAARKTDSNNSPYSQEICELEAGLSEVPKYPRLWVQDITPEQLAVKMAEQNERMAVFADEGGIFELLAGRYSKGVPNLDLFLQAHSGSPVRVDRGSRPPVMMQNPALTVGISPQPDVFESLADKPFFRGRGLLARVLFGLPASPLGNRRLEPMPCPDETVAEYSQLIERLLKLAPPERDGIWQPWVLNLSDEAYEAWKTFQRRVEALMVEGGKLHFVKDWASKLPGAAARVAAAFHCVISDPAEDPIITWQIMEHAIVLAELLMDHALAVFDLMERDKTTEDALKILGWIHRKALRSFTLRDCFCAHQGRFKKVDAIYAPLDLLEKHEYVRLAPKDDVAHRPSRIYQVNPKVQEDSE
jgi:hypothetical protein